MHIIFKNQKVKNQIEARFLRFLDENNEIHLNGQCHIEVVPAGPTTPFPTLALITRRSDPDNPDHLAVKTFLEELATLMMFDMIEVAEVLH